jgi:hypothetical protein
MFASRFESVIEAFAGGSRAPKSDAAGLVEGFEGDVIDSGTTAVVSVADMTSSLAAMIEDALIKVHRAMNYTEIEKLNMYVKDVQDQEKRRIHDTHETMANSLMVTQRLYLMNNREVDKLTSRIRVMLYTILTVCIIFAIMPYSSSAPGMTLMIVIGLSYLIGILIYIRGSGVRRYDDWNKIYWNTDVDPAAAAESAIVEDEDDADAGECTGTNLVLGEGVQAGLNAANCTTPAAAV